MELEILGKSPIESNPPCGLDVRYEPEFEELQNEIDKLSSPTGGTIEWSKVLELSSKILTEKSKDLLVTSYLCTALVELKGIEGFVKGLKIYKDMIENFWENLFPPKKRLRGRIRAIEWWIEKVGNSLKRKEIKEIPEELHKEINQLLEEIDKLLTNLLTEPPSFAPFKEFLESLAIKKIEKPKEKPLEKKKEEIPTEISSLQDVQRLLRDWQQTLRRIATYLWQEDNSNFLAYRFSRIANWSMIKELPPQVNGRTRIPAPPTQLIEQLKLLEKQGDWLNLLQIAESRFHQFIFWIDLQRWIYFSLENLGEKYFLAKQEVKRELLVFLERLTGIENLNFANGLPFSDDDTKNWLESIRKKEIVREKTEKKEEKTDFLAQLTEAKKLAQEGKINEAITGFQQKMRQAPSAKEKFLWRMNFIKFLFSIKEFGFALPHLIELQKEINEFNLEVWEPELAIESLSLLWQGFNALGTKGKQQSEEIIQRIAKIDVVKALKLRRH